MTSELRETRLPGIGVKWALTTASGSRVTVVQLNDGDREIYVHQRQRDNEPAAVVTLHDDEARQLAAVLGGVIERPKIVEELELALGELTIEWVPVPDDSWIVGRSLTECAFRRRTGTTVIAILREPEPVVGAQPDEVIAQGDTLVIVGKAQGVAAFHRLLAEAPEDL